MVHTGVNLSTVTESVNPWAVVKDYDRGGVCALGRIEAGNEGPQFQQATEIAAFKLSFDDESWREARLILRESGPHLVLARLRTETPKIEVFLTGKDHACQKVAETPLSKLKLEAAVDVVPVAAVAP